MYHKYELIYGSILCLRQAGPQLDMLLKQIKSICKSVV